MSIADTHGAIDAVWRIESARLIAGLARIVRDVGVAEELAQDALVVALERWPGGEHTKNQVRIASREVATRAQVNVQSYPGKS